MGILDLLRKVFGRSPVVPAQQPLETTAPSERRHQPRINARDGTTALVIDDSKTVLAVLRKFLRSAGYDTIECLDAESGLVALREKRPDLVFLDIMLPGMNGFAALRAIRRDPQTRDVPVIMMSGNEQAMEQFFGTRIGADDFMKKPFSRHELFFHIERLLDEDGVPRRSEPRTTLPHLQPLHRSPVQPHRQLAR